MKTVNLTDVAEIESRPVNEKIYPAGTIIIQVSATKGQVLYLRREREIESHYAVISSKNIHSFYLFSVIKKFFPPFFERKKQGLNFKAEELQKFQFPIHRDKERQDLIGRTMMKIGGERSEFYEEVK